MTQSLLTTVIMSTLRNPGRGTAILTGLTAQNISGRVRQHIKSTSHATVVAELTRLVATSQLEQIIRPHLPRRYRLRFKLKAKARP